MSVKTFYVLFFLAIYGWVVYQVVYPLAKGKAEKRRHDLVFELVRIREKTAKQLFKVYEDQPFPYETAMRLWARDMMLQFVIMQTPSVTDSDLRKKIASAKALKNFVDQECAKLIPTLTK